MKSDEVPKYLDGLHTIGLRSAQSTGEIPQEDIERTAGIFLEKEGLSWIARTITNESYFPLERVITFFVEGVMEYHLKRGTNKLLAVITVAYSEKTGLTTENNRASIVGNLIEAAENYKYSTTKREITTEVAEAFLVDLEDLTNLRYT